MDILEKIKNLCKERNWSVYRLAEESALTQSTLTNMFARRTLPSISTLTSICNAFGITLSQFFCEEESRLVLSEAEEKLVLNYRKLDVKSKDAVKTLIDKLN